MKASPRQLGLFDADRAEAEAARARMRGMIDLLRAATVAPWKKQIDYILQDGAFQRAMRLVPAAEASALWDEYNAEMERLHAAWVLTQEAPEG